MRAIDRGKNAFVRLTTPRSDGTLRRSLYSVIVCLCKLGYDVSEVIFVQSKHKLWFQAILTIKPNTLYYVSINFAIAFPNL